MPTQNSYVSCHDTKLPPKTLAGLILRWDLASSISRVVGDTFFCLLLSELKSSKERGTSKNKHAASDEENEGDDEGQSEDETDSEGEDMAEKDQSSSEEGTNWFYAGYKHEVIKRILVSVTCTAFTPTC